MTMTALAINAESYLKRLCVEFPTRRVGSQGNQDATAFFAEAAASFGLQTRCSQFDCMDWVTKGASLVIGEQSFEVFSSPYSLGCEFTAPLVSVTSVEELEVVETKSKILLLKGEIAREQLMPTKFPFYNPEEHKRIFRLLQEKKPSAIITATSRNPDLVGGIYPFPLIEDGDFNIPSVFMTETEGNRLSRYSGQNLTLNSQAHRIPSQGCNVIASKNPQSKKRIVLTAHIDDKDGTPGALDNASGVVMLLLLAELLADYQGSMGIELVAINGEDYYAASGEALYLKENKDRLNKVLLNINFDGIGYFEGDSAFSLYDCSAELSGLIRSTLAGYSAIIEGEQWFQGDHMVFVQNKIPAMAVTSQRFLQLFTTVTHTSRDKVELVDCSRLASTAMAIRSLLIELDKYFS
jgi:aminopeptidase YwaD